MYDMHIHTSFSFDSSSDVFDVCETAVKNGLKGIAITNHCDYDGIKVGIYPEYDAKADYRNVCEAKDKYKGILDIKWGVELGQAHVMTNEIKEYIEENKFEFILASMHNLRNVPDFYYLNYTYMTQRHCEYLWERYIDELGEVVETGIGDSIAHFTYPFRYLERDGRSISVDKYLGKFEDFFAVMIKNNVALEVNTSGLRTNWKCMPDFDIVNLYRSCGGKRVTTGSDSHCACDVGSGIIDTYNKLKEIGFEYINEI